MDWQTMTGLVGITIVISGSNLLPQFRGWCRDFTDPMQPLRWLGTGLEFLGLVTDKAMATGFVLGILWWTGENTWGQVFVLSGILALLSAGMDVLLAILYASVKRVMGPATAPAMPMAIPRGTRPSELATKLARGAALSEEEAWEFTDEKDREMDLRRGSAN